MDFSNWLVQLQDMWRSTFAAIAANLPSVLGALALLLVGWLLAKIARGLIIRLAGFANRGLQNISEATLLSRFSFSTPVIRLAGNAVYWLVILVFLTAAAQSLELHAFSIWLAKILNYVPVLLAGAVIIVAGYILSIFVRDVVSTALTSGGFRQGALLGTVAQGAVLLIAVIIGVDQIGVDVAFLTTIVAIALAGVVGGFALAFGFGSRDFVSNIIAANDLRQHYEIGQNVQVGDTSGEIIELTPTSVVLATKDGRATVPAQLFHQTETLLLTSEEAHG